jgi:hypothetical protein
MTFDTLAYAKKLKAAGVPDEQAEIQAEALKDIVNKDRDVGMQRYGDIGK